jgi:DeoR family transcriptional regulator, suf operon transcriptional repressor
MSDRSPQSTVPDREHLTAALDSLPATRRKILDHIKRQDSASSEQIAGALGITPSAIRQHLSALTADGLIQYQIQRGGPGRPTHRYTLTGAGDALFPRNYVDLTNELLSYIEDEDAELLSRVFDKRGLARLARARLRVDGLPFAQKVAMVARILDEDGYLADFTELADGSFRLTEHNCAVLAIAQRYQHACRTEIEFLQALLPEADVVRVAHRLKSGHICSYEIALR